jgi:hypothetical protein
MLGKKIIFFFRLIFLLSIGGCSSEPEQEAKDIAMSLFTKKDNMCVQYRDKNTQCKDFKFKSYEALELISSDEANGIAEKWYITISYLVKTPKFNQKTMDWETSKAIYYAEKRNGVWEVHNYLSW